MAQNVTRDAFLIGAGAALAIAPRVAGAQPLVHLTTAGPAIDPGLTLLVGIRAGIYRRYGIDLDLQPAASGAAISAGVAGGALQIGSSSLMGLISAHVRGIPFQIIAPASIYVSERPAELLLVRKDSPILGAADLGGKTVASPALGDLLASATMAWIDQNGGDAKLVRQIEIPPTATPAALESGRIDAAAVQEPRLSSLLRSGNFRVLGKPYDVIGKHFLVSVEFALADFINANRATIERFARGTREANAFANAHPDRTAPWLAEFAKVDLDSILHSNRAEFAEALLISDVQVVIDAAARFKVIERPFDARELISPVVLNLR